MKKTLSLLLVVVMAMLALAGCGTDYTSKNTEYFIGCTGPLTGSASSYGISVKQGAELAIKEINANGGLNDVKFKFQMIDDQAAADKAGLGYDQLYEAGMQIAIGSVTSGSCEAFGNKAGQDNLFYMTPSASAETCIKPASGFRVCFGDPDQGVLAAQEISSKYENVGVIYDESDPYSSGIYTAFEAEMKKIGKAYTVKSFNAENKKDFSTQVEALKDCDVIFLPIYYTEAGLIAKAAVTKGCDAVIFGCDGLDGIKDQIDETVTNKIMYITPFDVNSTDAVVSKFVENYKAAYGTEPDQFAADGYDAVMAIYEAMKAANVNDVTIAPEELTELVIPAITAEGFTYTGATGTMSWAASGAATKTPVIIELN